MGSHLVTFDVWRSKHDQLLAEAEQWRLVREAMEGRCRRRWCRRRPSANGINANGQGVTGVVSEWFMIRYCRRLGAC